MHDLLPCVVAFMPLGLLAPGALYTTSASQPFAPQFVEAWIQLFMAILVAILPNTVPPTLKSTWPRVRWIHSPAILCSKSWGPESRAVAIQVVPATPANT